MNVCKKWGDVKNELVRKKLYRGLFIMSVGSWRFKTMKISLIMRILGL
jgi:hypothetical protein